MPISVKKIIDGDTFMDEGGEYYRLANVNAPEKGRRGAIKATETLRDLIEGERLVVDEVGKSYGRSVVKIRKVGEKTTINEKMRRKGFK